MLSVEDADSRDALWSKQWRDIVHQLHPSLERKPGGTQDENNYHFKENIIIHCIKSLSGGKTLHKINELTFDKNPTKNYILLDFWNVYIHFNRILMKGKDTCIKMFLLILCPIPKNKSTNSSTSLDNINKFLKTSG